MHWESGSEVEWSVNFNSDSAVNTASLVFAQDLVGLVNVDKSPFLSCASTSPLPDDLVGFSVSSSINGGAFMVLHIADSTVS